MPKKLSSNNKQRKKSKSVNKILFHRKIKNKKQKTHRNTHKN
jgi:hypothetical protein